MRKLVAATLAAVLVTAACSPSGGSPDQWRAATASRLLDLLEVAPPMPLFEAPRAAPTIHAIADPALLLMLGGQALPTQTAAQLGRFWKPKEALLSDSVPREFADDERWLALRVLLGRRDSATSRLTRQVVAGVVKHLRSEALPAGGFVLAGSPSVRPAGTLDIAQTVTALRMLDLISRSRDVDAATQQAVRQLRQYALIRDPCAARAAENQPDEAALLDIGSISEAARLEGVRCDLGPQWRNVLAPGLTTLRFGQGLRSPASIVARLSAYVSLGQTGNLPPSDVKSATARLVSSYLDTAADPRQGHLVPDEAELGRNVFELAAAVGVPVSGRLPAPLVAGARRLLRWDGRFFDVVVPGGQGQETAFGLSALLLLRDTTRSQGTVEQLLVDVERSTGWSLSRLDPGDRLAVAAAVSRDAVGVDRVQHIRSEIQPQSATAVQLLALTASRDAPCGDQERAVMQTAVDGLSHLAPTPKPSDPHLLFEGYVISKAGARCGAFVPGWSEQAVLLALAPVRRLLVSHSQLPGNQRANMQAVWMAAELDCLLGQRVAAYAKPYASALAKQRLGAGGLTNGQDDVFDIGSTYASLRVSELVSSGCSPGWWAGAGPKPVVALTPPTGSRKAP